jgi:hypothetical protein
MLSVSARGWVAPGSRGASIGARIVLSSSAGAGSGSGSGDTNDFLNRFTFLAFFFTFVYSFFMFYAASSNSYTNASVYLLNFRSHTSLFFWFSALLLQPWQSVIKLSIHV